MPTPNHRCKAKHDGSHSHDRGVNYHQDKLLLVGRSCPGRAPRSIGRIRNGYLGLLILADRFEARRLKGLLLGFAFGISEARISGSLRGWRFLVPHEIELHYVRISRCQNRTFKETLKALKTSRTPES